MYNFVLKNFQKLNCLNLDERMDTFNSYDQRHHHHQNLDYGVDQNDSALFDNIINSYEKADHELDGKNSIFTLKLSFAIQSKVLRLFKRSRNDTMFK